MEWSEAIIWKVIPAFPIRIQDDYIHYLISSIMSLSVPVPPIWWEQRRFCWSLSFRRPWWYLGSMGGRKQISGDGRVNVKWLTLSFGVWWNSAFIPRLLKNSQKNMQERCICDKAYTWEKEKKKRHYGPLIKLTWMISSFYKKNLYPN